MEVKVAFEDMSGGVAAKDGERLLGVRLSGLWHSSLWAFDSWFSFAGTIVVGQSPLSSTEVLSYGRTARTQAEFSAFLSEVRERFEGKYDFFYLNCHTFTQACLQFLLGSHLPAHFFNLPKQFLALPLDYGLKERLIGVLSTDDWEMEETRPSHAELFGTDLQEITQAKELHYAGLAEWAVVLYWRSDIDFAFQRKIRTLAMEYRDRGQFWAVNAEERKTLGPVLHQTCVEVLSHGTRLALISDLDSELVAIWLRPPLRHTQVLSSTAPLRFPTLCRPAVLSAVRSFPRLYDWLHTEKCLHMPSLLNEALGLPVATALHVIGVLALEPAGAEAIGKDWETVYSRVEQAINRGSPQTAALALRLLVNLYSSEPGIQLCVEQMPMLHGLALSALERNTEELRLPASALYFNLLLTYPEAVERDEFLPAAKALQGILKGAEKELEALYAAKALALLATTDLRVYLKETACPMQLRSAIHIAIAASLREVLDY